MISQCLRLHLGMLLLCAAVFAQETTNSQQFSLIPVETPQTLTLQDVFLRAENSNKDILVAKEQLKQQKGRLRSAWALYLPKLKLDGTYTLNFPEITANFGSKTQNLQQAQLFNNIADLLDVTRDQRTNPVDIQRTIAQATGLRQAALQLNRSPILSVVIQPAQVFDANLSLSQPLLDMPAYESIQTATLEQKRSENTYQRVRTDVLTDVARAYFQAVRARRLTQIAHNKKIRSDAQVRRMKEKYRLALARMVDVHRLEVEASNANEQLVEAQANEEFALGNLGMLIGEKEQFYIEQNNTVKPLDKLSPVNRLLEQATAHRDDLKVQLHTVKLAHQEQASADALFYPTLDIVGQGLYTSNTSGFVNKPFRGVVMLQASWQLYDGGNRYGKRQEALGRMSEEKIKLNDLQRRIESEIRAKLTDIKTKERMLQTARETLYLQKKVYKDTQNTFQGGLLEILDLIDANQQLADGERKLENAQTDLDLARIELASSCGNIFDAVGNES